MTQKSTKNIGWALLFNVIFFVIEIIGGLLTNSISIISDAIHDCGDTIAIAVSWVLEKVSEKKPNEKYTFGYMRFSFLGALINSLILLISCVLICYETLPRLFAPEEVHHDGMIALALVGIVFKGLGAYKTAKGAGVSERAVSLHLLGDVLMWVAALIVSLIIKFFNVTILDPLLSFGIVVFILVNVIGNLRMIFRVLLERAPENVDVAELKAKLMEHEQIIHTHHLHMWMADGVNTYCTLHLVVKDGLSEEEISKIKCFVRGIMEGYEIGHITMEIEFECERCKEDDCEFEMRGHQKFKKQEGHNHLGCSHNH